MKNLIIKESIWLMKMAGLRSVSRIKKKQYKRSTPQHVAENILNREFTAEIPNEEKWLRMLQYLIMA
jgi:putative transposase